VLDPRLSRGYVSSLRAARLALGRLATIHLRLLSDAGLIFD
jgi:hypothetical protein